jgi:hypothetical protein
MATYSMIDVVMFFLLICFPLAAIGVLLMTHASYLVPKIGELSTSKLDDFENEREAQSRRDGIEAELRSRKRNSKYGTGVDRTIVEASEATKDISILFKMLTEATGSCCEMHLLAADIAGVSEMEDVRWDPVCANLRQNVLATTDVAIQHLDSYPIAGPKVIKQGMALRGFQRVCGDCELLKYSRDDAPLLCRPAKLTGNKASETNFQEHAES